MVTHKQTVTHGRHTNIHSDRHHTHTKHPHNCDTHQIHIQPSQTKHTRIITNTKQTHTPTHLKGHTYKHIHTHQTHRNSDTHSKQRHTHSHTHRHTHKPNTGTHTKHRHTQTPNTGTHTHTHTHTHQTDQTRKMIGGKG